MSSLTVPNIFADHTEVHALTMKTHSSDLTRIDSSDRGDSFSSKFASVVLASSSAVCPAALIPALVKGEFEDTQRHALVVHVTGTVVREQYPG